MKTSIYFSTARLNPSLRHAALAAGLGYLLTPTPFAEFYAYPTLVIPGHIDETAQNISAHSTLFAFCILAYVGSYLCDIVIACSLYYLLRPVSKPLSLIAAWFQLVYSAVGLSATLHLVTALQLTTSLDDARLFGDTALHQQLRILLLSFRSEWGVSMLLFGVHLGAVGYLICRSTYIPKFVGVAVIAAGIGYVAVNMNTYLFPEPSIDAAAVLLLGELVLMAWLLIWGWRIPEQADAHARKT